jgi:hypothetical protein
VGVRLKTETLRLKRLHQNPTRFPLRIPSKLKLSKLNLADNGLALGVVADFGALNCQYTTKVDAR